MHASVVAFALVASVVSATIDFTSSAMTFDGSSDKVLPYLLAQSTDVADDAIELAKICIHGLQRKASECFAFDQDRFDQANAVLLAPIFKTATALDGCPTAAAAANEVGWKTCNAFADGQRPSNDDGGAPDAYSMLDALVLHVKATYPNVRAIQIFGFSLGGQTVNRYAALTTIESDPALDGVVDVTFLAASASSWLFPDAMRPVQQPDGSVAFEVPATDCAYNTFKYGLDGIDASLEYPAYDAAPARVADRLATRIVYGINLNDTGMTDTSCASRSQGPNSRVAKMQLYMQYFAHVYGTQPTSFAVGGCGHSAECFYADEAAQDAVFP
ncbi:Aste57867_753 [Aphanomyces stellatus]|uniref:Aste57867_753 protein n=1 Tax=Aphanomyces stellatus TaxID=120398 RepID=A0A485K3S8_9STRA|nr:hypothetical protein As57867_000752 [Aphanomyces stellatus]VFT77977.1 Aste57867_753 [Aphanomyces stellatus]